MTQLLIQFKQKIRILLIFMLGVQTTVAIAADTTAGDDEPQVEVYHNGVTYTQKGVSENVTINGDGSASYRIGSDENGWRYMDEEEIANFKDDLNDPEILRAIQGNANLASLDSRPVSTYADSNPPSMSSVAVSSSGDVTGLGGSGLGGFSFDLGSGAGAAAQTTPQSTATAAPQSEAAPASSETKAKEKAKKDEGTHNPVYNNRMIIPQVMADYCAVSADEIIEDNEKMHDCVRKYLTQMRNSDTSVSFQAGKDYRLMQYKLIIDNMIEALKISLAVAHYEEAQNKQSESRAEGSTVRDQEAGLSNSRAFTINVANDIINTTADFLKYKALSNMGLIDTRAMENDALSAQPEVSGAEFEGEFEAELASGTATVELTEPAADDAMVVDDDVSVTPADELKEGACLIVDNVWIDSGTSLKVGENRYVNCNEGVLTMNSKVEKGGFNQGERISGDSAKTLITAAPTEYQTVQTVNIANQLLGGDVTGMSPRVEIFSNGVTYEERGISQSVIINADGSATYKIGSDETSWRNMTAEEIAVFKEEVLENPDLIESIQGNENLLPLYEDGNLSATEDAPESAPAATEIAGAQTDTETYSGVYNGRQLYPNVMANYCQINGEDMAADINQIEDCMIKYIVSKEQEDASDREVSRQDYDTLRMATLNMLLAQAMTKEKNELPLQQKLEEEYQAVADNSDDQQKDVVTTAETGAFLTDVINAMRDMYADKMKYEGVLGLQGIDLETVQTAQPQSAMIQALKVKDKQR